jgi:1,4-dihydroxy-2-naphthoyl-CoA hydrolase
VAISPNELPALPPELKAEQLIEKLGIEVVSWESQRLVGTMPVAGNRQAFGLLHGGASAVLAETLGSIAAAMHTMPERFPVGLELSCTHHRAVTEGLVTGVATPLHVGRTASTFQIVISDESGRRSCTAQLTCIHLDAMPGPQAVDELAPQAT